jgi:hypothetical protein
MLFYIFNSQIPISSHETWQFLFEIPCAVGCVQMCVNIFNGHESLDLMLKKVSQMKTIKKALILFVTTYAMRACFVFLFHL